MLDKEQELSAAITVFEQSSRDREDYLRFMMAVHSALRQGSGLLWSHVQEILNTTLQEKPDAVGTYMWALRQAQKGKVIDTADNNTICRGFFWHKDGLYCNPNFLQRQTTAYPIDARCFRNNKIPLTGWSVMGVMCEERRQKLMKW